MDELTRKRAEWFVSADEGEMCPVELRNGHKYVFGMMQDTVKQLLYHIDDLERTIKVMKATE